MAGELLVPEQAAVEDAIPLAFARSDSLVFLLRCLLVIRLLLASEGPESACV